MLDTLKKQFEKTVCLFHWIGFLNAILQLASKIEISLDDARQFVAALPKEFFVDSKNPFVDNHDLLQYDSLSEIGDDPVADQNSTYWRDLFLVSEDADDIYRSPNPDVPNFVVKICGFEFKWVSATRKTLPCFKLKKVRFSPEADYADADAYAGADADAHTHAHTP